MYWFGPLRCRRIILFLVCTGQNEKVTLLLDCIYMPLNFVFRYYLLFITWVALCEAVWRVGACCRVASVHDGDLPSLPVAMVWCHVSLNFRVISLALFETLFSWCRVFGVSTNVKCSARHSLPQQNSNIWTHVAWLKFWNEAAPKFPGPSHSVFFSCRTRTFVTSHCFVFCFHTVVTKLKSRCRTGQCLSKIWQESVGASPAS